MRKSTRLLILLLVFEIGLFAFGLWLMNGLRTGELHAASSNAETVRTVWSVLGGAMGVLAGTMGVAVIAMRRKGL